MAGLLASHRRRQLWHLFLALDWRTNMAMNLSNEQLDAAIMILSMDTQQGSRMVASKLQAHWQRMQEPGDPASKPPLDMSEDDKRIVAAVCKASKDEGAAELATLFAPAEALPPDPDLQVAS